MPVDLILGDVLEVVRGPPDEKAIWEYTVDDWKAIEARVLPAENRKLRMRMARTEGDLPWTHPWLALANMCKREEIHMLNGDIWAVLSITDKMLRLKNQKGVVRHLKPMSTETHAGMIRDIEALLFFGDDLGGHLFEAMARDPIFEGKPIQRPRPGPQQMTLGVD